MKHPTLIAALGAVGLAAGLSLSAPANAGTAWSVSIGAPSYAVPAPVYYGHRHWHRGYVAPVIYSAPVVYRAPVVVAPPVVYSAPIVYGPRVVYAPRVVHRHW